MRRGEKFVLCIVAACVLLCSCQKGEPKEKVSLKLWGPEGNQELLREMSDEFCENYKDQAEIDIHIGVEDENDFKGDYLKNVEGSADVFSFVDDQLYELVSHKSLLPITFGTDKVILESGGEDSPAVQSAMCEGQLYACPKTASNGYFLYYNSEYFSEKDIKSFDQILKVAEKAGKKVYMDWSSGWYIYSFFGGAGFELKLNSDRVTNQCNWNKKSGKYAGTDVAEAMLRISSSEAFFSGNNDEFREGVEKGEIIAGVSGTWNVDIVSKTYGDHYAAAKLPTYTIQGDQVQMASFSGYKLMGVNATTKQPEWAQKLAIWLTNEQNQKRFYEKTGEGTANIKAAQSQSVQKSPAIKALLDQRQYSIVQNVGGNFWDAATAFGMIMVSGNKDNLSLQDVLNDLVEETEAPLKEN